MKYIDLTGEYVTAETLVKKEHVGYLKELLIELTHIVEDFILAYNLNNNTLDYNVVKRYLEDYVIARLAQKDELLKVYVNNSELMDSILMSIYIKLVNISPNVSTAVSVIIH